MRTKLGFLATLFFAASVHAQQPFYAALTGADVQACFILPSTEFRLEWIAPDHVESNTTVQMIASGDGRHVFGLLFGAGVRIVRVEPDGTQTPFYTDLAAGSAGALAVAADGRVFVAFFAAGTFQLAVISPTGVLQATYPMPVTQFPSTMAIADDGCTIFYVTNGTAVHRFNACTGTPLPDFASGFLLGVNDVDPLPSGDVLVAHRDTVRLYNAAGAFVRTVASLPTYGFNSSVFIGQVEANSAGVFLTVTGCGVQGVLLRVALSDGTELSRQDISLNHPNALVLGAAAAGAGIPTASTIGLLLIAIGIAAVALTRL